MGLYVNTKIVQAVQKVKPKTELLIVNLPS